MDKVEGKKKSCLRPMPPAIVSCRDKSGRDNALVVGYAANCSFDPPMVIVGIREERFSHHMIKETGVFVVNIASKANKEMYNYLGTVSGKKEDKFKKMNIASKTGDIVNAPLILDCPVNIECKVVNTVITGSHTLFIGTVEKVHADKNLVDSKGNIDYDKIDYMD
jgi:flavin reductase (DIM6/NTAB) family NADH-FMN oxidoreductase RutF